MENIPSNARANKRSKGRQRIPMDQRREREEDRQVTFSKRRSGLYKKISELSLVCAIDFIIMILSPTGKLHSFSSPNMELIAMKLLNNKKLESNMETNSLMETSVRENLARLTSQLVEVKNLLDKEKEREKQIDKMVKARKTKSIIDTPVSDLNEGDAKMLEDWLKMVGSDLHARINQLSGN
ncbi:agamous-like MADS-box protein AGL62 [Impatiens glandulifera]|uniref:agamous-like MADS-box protein AGL62 n=1 Tax=Impatiens glandulifera TaxID=253017 RepID=UPI001FB0DE67|nr:agamous-like MADS-box protein AGL62 [Impatiens glandulifera]XP_047309604.1 agamous-like MADS-box protein AGL62 [Impatiens glandulifera]